MKILIESADGANRFIAKQYNDAFIAAGHNVVWWKSEGKSAFDIFSENDPIDLCFLHSWKLNKAIVKNLVKRPETTIVLRIPHWGSGDKDIDVTKYPIQFATDEEKRLVEELVQKCPNLKFGFCQYANHRIVDTHDLWSNIGLKTYGILLSANILDYNLTPLDESYHTNVVFQGGYWTYKAINLDRFITPITYPNTNWKIKIFGTGWNLVNSLGTINTDSMKRFYRNADISPNIFEPHSITYGLDVNQRSYEISACGGFQISQRVKSLQEDIFNDDEIIFVDTPKEFFDSTVYYLNHQNETTTYREKAYKTVMSSHTNIHRAIELFRLCDFDCTSLMSLLDIVQRGVVDD